MAIIAITDNRDEIRLVGIFWRKLTTDVLTVQKFFDNIKQYYA